MIVYIPPMIVNFQKIVYFRKIVYFIFDARLLYMIVYFTSPGPTLGLKNEVRFRVGERFSVNLGYSWDDYYLDLMP